MCDTVVVVPERGPVWFAKNSDREPNEIQFIEYDDLDATQTAPIGWPVDPPSERTLLSRPGWMWGAEIGVNEHGVAIGNEAVFTRLPVPKEGRTGMDFLRVALGVSHNADDALDLLIDLTERFAQGGRMGHRNKTFRYSSSFLVADRNKAWVFETAGHLWAARRVRGVATISNELTIEDDFDRVHTGAYEVARKRGWVKSASAFSFAAAFSNPLVSNLAGARARRACTARSLSGASAPDVRDFARALSDHGEVDPTKGWRGMSPCAHASWLPTRRASQTTSSLIARLGKAGPEVWATGTSSPCLSVFKPVPFDSSLFPMHRIADHGYEGSRLWWAHERLHRAVLRDYHARRATFAVARDRFQDECLRADVDPRQVWKEHRRLIDEWLAQVLAVKSPASTITTAWYWKSQSKQSEMPA